MKLLYLLPILLIVGCISDASPITGLISGVTEPFSDPEPVPISIGIHNGETLRVDMITVLEGTTALEAFREIADVQTREVNFASYVFAIDGLAENPRENRFWMFYVNNEPSIYGVSDYIIEEPSNLEFRYENPPEHQ